MPETKWYFKTYGIVVAILLLGPLAFPLIWFNPHYSLKKKAVLTAIIIILTWFLSLLLLNALRSLKQYYSLILQNNM